MGYNRRHAVNYARAFWNRVCHDGKVATRSGYPRKINGKILSPGLPFSAIGQIEHEEDCTHFISCCVGQTAKVKVEDTWNEPNDPWVTLKDVNSAIGGGLHIPSPWASIGVYGHDTTPVLIGALIAHGAKIIPNPKITPDPKSYAHWFWTNPGTETGSAIQENLTPGDVLAYAWQSDRYAYAHMALLVGPNAQIACHTSSRWYQDYTSVFTIPWVTLIRLP
ncbi:MAG: hypothetical protein LAQ69_23175 [Acidobacteriia bacterium]|nr:hypothetical protein [Terriglobia bacterium]